MTNLYYDLPNDILWKIDHVLHKSNMKDVVHELHKQVQSGLDYNERLQENCIDKLRAFREILHYEENLSELKQMVKEQPHCPILKNRIDCAEGGLAWLYCHYDMDRIQ